MMIVVIGKEVATVTLIKLWKIGKNPDIQQQDVGYLVMMQ